LIDTSLRGFAAKVISSSVREIVSVSTGSGSDRIKTNVA
jgi:hypothetical protein